MNLFDLLTDYTLRNVALGAALLGAVAGALGSFAVLRKQSLLGDAMSHAALPGVALAFILTGSKSPFVLLTGALIAAVAGAALMMVTTARTRIKADSALGVVLAVFFGVGLVLMSWVQRNAGANQAGLDKFLFGRAAAIVQEDVIVMAVFSGLALVLLALFWKEFKLLTFDADYAATLGYPVRLLHGLLMTLIVVSIVVGLQLVGVVLMSALVVAPAAAARQWTDRLGVMVALAAGIGAASGVGGALVSSVASGLATGPVIVLFASELVAVSIAFGVQHGMVWDWLRQRRQRREMGAGRVLEVLYDMGQHHHDPHYPHAAVSVQAVLPGYRVAAALVGLARQGFVQQVDDLWALTDKGLAEVQALKAHTGREA